MGIHCDVIQSYNGLPPILFPCIPRVILPARPSVLIIRIPTCPPHVRVSPTFMPPTLVTSTLAEVKTPSNSCPASLCPSLTCAHMWPVWVTGCISFRDVNLALCLVVGLIITHWVPHVYSFCSPLGFVIQHYLCLSSRGCLIIPVRHVNLCAQRSCVYTRSVTALVVRSQLVMVYNL